MSAHAALATRILAAITAKGSPVTFPNAGGMEQTHDPTTGTWTGGSTGSDIIAYAVRTRSDPASLAALNLKLINPVTLIVAAKDLAVAPRPGVPMVFGGVTYSILQATAHGASDTPVYYEVTGDVQ